MGDKPISSRYRSLADCRQGKQGCEGGKVVYWADGIFNKIALLPPLICHQFTDMHKASNCDSSCLKEFFQKRLARFLSWKNITKVRLSGSMLDDATSWEITKIFNDSTFMIRAEDVYFPGDGWLHLVTVYIRRRSFQKLGLTWPLLPLLHGSSNSGKIRSTFLEKNQNCNSLHGKVIIKYQN